MKLTIYWQLLAFYCLLIEALPADVSSGSVETQVENPNKKAFFNTPIKSYRKKTDPVDKQEDTSENSTPPKTLIVIGGDQLKGTGITKIRRIQLRRKSDSVEANQDSSGSLPQNETPERVPERSSAAGKPIDGGVMVQRGIPTPVITTNDEEFIIISRKNEDGSEVAISNVPEEEIVDQTEIDIEETPETFIRGNPVIVNVKQKKPMVPKTESNPTDADDLLESASASKIYLLPPPSDMENLDIKRSDETKVYSVSRAQANDKSDQMITLNSQDDELKKTKTFSKLCGNKEAKKNARKTFKSTEKGYQEDDSLSPTSNNKEEPIRRFDESMPNDNPPIIIPQPVMLINKDSMRQDGGPDVSDASIEPETSPEPELNIEDPNNVGNYPNNIRAIIYGKPQGTDVSIQALPREEKEKKMKKKLEELGDEFQIPDELTAIEKDEEVLVPRNPAVSIRESGVPASAEITSADARK